MSYVKVLTSVPRHAKFLAAGPAAAWLWVCGNCYCQDGLTDGHIPKSAIGQLGVPGKTRALRLAQTLVDAGLWHRVADGWEVHDYLEENRSADEVRTLKAKRRASGKQGGRPRREKQSVNTDESTLLSDEKQTENPASATASATAVQKKEPARPAPSFPQPVEKPDDWRRRRSNGTDDDGDPKHSVLTALAVDVLGHSQAGDEGALAEDLKTAAARANLAYDGHAIARALEAAQRRVMLERLRQRVGVATPAKARQEAS